jgi:hypothetical protein
MTTIRIAVDLDATPNEVWADVRNLASHVEWMHDAVAIDFTSESTEGVGTTFDCLTKVGPISLTDKMRVTAWDEPRCIGVRHEGLVSGEGVFVISALRNGRSSFAWEERLKLPWFLGGPFGAFVVGAIMKLIWKRNLRKFQARFRR